MRTLYLVLSIVALTSVSGCASIVPSPSDYTNTGAPALLSDGAIPPPDAGPRDSGR